MEELKAIDTQAIEELARIKAEQEVLEQRLEKMSQSRDQVSEKVFQRVQADYSSQNEALEAKAEPLKARAREEFARLESILGELRADFDNANLDREELRFRHELGEFEDGDFEQRDSECVRRIEEQETLVREAEALEKRFLAAFRSEDELRRGPAEIPVTQRIELAPDAAAPLDGDSSGKEGQADGGEQDGGAASEVEGETLDETLLGKTVPKHVGPLQTIIASIGGGSETLVKNPVRVIVQKSDFSSEEEYILGMEPLTIGRAEDNEICINSPTVSRHHARLKVGKKGAHLVEDLGSGNGVLLNAEPVDGEAELTDGDFIQLGTEVVLFRER